MLQLETVPNPCPKCFDAFAKQRTHFCKEIVRHQSDYFAQQHEIKSLQAELRNALEKLHQETHRAVNAEREKLAGMFEQFGGLKDGYTCAAIIRARDKSCSPA